MFATAGLINILVGGSSGSRGVKMARKYSLSSGMPSLMMSTSISCDITVSLKNSSCSMPMKSKLPARQQTSTMTWRARIALAHQWLCHFEFR